MIQKQNTTTPPYWPFVCNGSSALTAVQTIYLNPETGAKADLTVPKRTSGVLIGSFVTLQWDLDHAQIYVAEGVETALSLRADHIPGNILVSLGVFNFKHLASYLDRDLTPVITLCADPDTPGSPAHTQIQKAKTALQEAGFPITILTPTAPYDFNDVLMLQGLGVQSQIMMVWIDDKFFRLILPSF